MFQLVVLGKAVILKQEYAVIRAQPAGCFAMGPVCLPEAAVSILSAMMVLIALLMFAGQIISVLLQMRVPESRFVMRE